MMDYWEAQERKDMMKSADEEGRVADSKDYRIKLMQRVHDGELSLQEAQKQLASVKRNAKKNGKITRNQAWNGH